MTQIKQGCHSLTGGWLANVWVISRTATAPMKFQRLADAKDFCKRHYGIDGKWARSVEYTGPRGRKRVVYSASDSD